LDIIEECLSVLLSAEETSGVSIEVLTLAFKIVGDDGCLGLHQSSDLIAIK